MRVSGESVIGDVTSCFTGCPGTGGLQNSHTKAQGHKGAEQTSSGDLVPSCLCVRLLFPEQWRRSGSTRMSTNGEECSRTTLRPATFALIRGASRPFAWNDGRGLLNAQRPAPGVFSLAAPAGFSGSSSGGIGFGGFGFWRPSSFSARSRMDSTSGCTSSARFQ